MAEDRPNDVRDDDATEFGPLVLRYLDQAVTPEEQELLETRLRASDADRRLFLELCEQVCFVNEVVLSLRAPARRAEATKQPPKDRPPLLTFLGDAFQAGGDFLSRPFALSILFTIALPGVILLVLLISLSTQTTPRLPAPPQVPRPVASADLNTARVAHVTRAHQCVWAEGSEPFSNGSSLPPGGQLRLDKGLVEIAFAEGARVIVQGPAVFDATSAKQGFLRVGSLVAHVAGEARGFAVETPTAKVVDLGTEFGVCVEESGHAADVQVFQGEVELTLPAAKDQEPARHRLSAGTAVCVATTAQESAVTISRIAPRQDRFVREMPGTIVADFSGGAGVAQADQLPGAAGEGWATGWEIRGVPELSCDASIEQSNPVLGGGEYMRVLMERKPGGPDEAPWAGVDRRMEVKGPVDLTKRYTTSFNVRIDTLGRLSTPSDRLSICSRSKSQAQHAIKEEGMSIGWLISMARARSGEPAQWVFSYRGAGKGAKMSSGISVREGAVYSFRILVDPQAGQWTPAIAVDGGPWTAFKPMSMRSPKTAEENGYWPYWHCYWLTHFEKGEDAGDGMELSIDSFRVAPE